MENNKKYKPNKKGKKNFTKEELKQLSHEELVNMIIQFQSHNEQLKNIISKQNTINKSVRTNPKDFIDKGYNQLHILLKILYYGWDCQGFATQEDTNATIEYHLFDALHRSHLIQCRETSNYHRCGRTDKGVSAFSQVISITVRARPENKEPLNYCRVLNRLLPDHIRAIAWQPIDVNFSARFNCENRTYRYFFPKSNLNLKENKPKYQVKMMMLERLEHVMLFKL